ncbi:hypothetical protein D3C73_1569480 [compost metagenome]
MNISRISGLDLGIHLTEQVENILPFNLQLPDDELLDEIVLRLVNDLLRRAELRDFPLIYD